MGKYFKAPLGNYWNSASINSPVEFQPDKTILQNRCKLKLFELHSSKILYPVSKTGEVRRLVISSNFFKWLPQTEFVRCVKRISEILSLCLPRWISTLFFKCPNNDSFLNTQGMIKLVFCNEFPKNFQSRKTVLGWKSASEDP